MSSVNVYNLEGNVVGTHELPASIFGLPVSAGLLQLAVVAQAANRRRPIAHTKTRGEVRGGGRKPWKQKGTGRARHGSIRSPIWIGGGITFGPRSVRNFSLKINRQARRRALLESLSAKAAQAEIVLVNDLSPIGRKSKLAHTALRKLKLRPTPRKHEAGFTKQAVVGESATVNSGGAAAKRSWPKVLIVLAPAARDQVLAFRNLKRVSVISAESLNVKDILGHQMVVVGLDGLDRLREVYEPKIKVAASAKK